MIKNCLNFNKKTKYYKFYQYRKSKEILTFLINLKIIDNIISYIYINIGQ